MDEIKKFDPNDIANTLKDKVKQEFVNLIPEEYWDTFIADTTKKFMENDLESVVKEALKADSNKKILTYLNEDLNNNWNAKKNRNVLDNRLKELIVNLAPQMFAEMMEQMIMTMMQNLRNRGY